MNLVAGSTLETRNNILGRALEQSNNIGDEFALALDGAEF